MEFIVVKEELMKTLKDVAVGDKAIVKRLSGEGALKRRIMDNPSLLQIPLWECANF